jgi:transcriptional regulator with XRE-family HTH domain
MCAFNAMQPVVRTMTIQRDIYPNLKLRIYTSGLRQNRMAKMLGIDEAHLSKVINGFREPSEQLKTQIAEILQSDPEWLFHKVLLTGENSAINDEMSGPKK